MGILPALIYFRRNLSNSAVTSGSLTDYLTAIRVVPAVRLPVRDRRGWQDTREDGSGRAT